MGFFDKLKKINIFASFGSELNDDFYDELEESLILADTGMDVTLELVEELKSRVRQRGIKTLEEARSCMVEVIADALSAGETALNLSTRPSVVLFIGVNGVGKTTTIGKIGRQLKGERKKVLSVSYTHLLMRQPAGFYISPFAGGSPRRDRRTAGVDP